MINNLKLKTIIPFSLSAICLALSACGGESATINEDPNAGFSVAFNGCNRYLRRVISSLGYRYRWGNK